MKDEKLYILNLEDNPNDTELIQATLDREKLACELVRVETKADYVSAVEQGCFDLLLVDYKLPGFDGMSALTIAREKCPDVPFIFVSGSIGEDMAIEALKNGATDYVLKDKMSRLAPAVRRALNEAKERIERKQVEEALRKTQSLTESVLASMADVYILFDRQWRYLYVNDAAVRSMGLPCEQILGRTLWELYPDIADTELDRQYHRAMDDCLPVAFEFHYQTTDTWWENRFYPVPEGLAVFATDITKRKRSETALMESEKRYKDLAKLLPQAVYELDDAGKIIFANRRGLDMFGYTQEDVDRGLDVTKVVIPEDIDRLLEDLQKLLDGAQIGSLEYTALRKDGSTFPILSFDTPILRDNKIVGFRGIGIDITERKRAEAAIEASEKKLQALFDTVNDAIMVLDPQGRILDVNNVTCERLGYRRDELLKMTPHDFDTPEYSVKLTKRLAEVRRKGSAIFETAWITRDGRIVPTEISTRSIEYDGKPAIISVARDITERKQAEDALKKSEKFNRNILETVDEGFIVIDPEYKIISANKAYLNMINRVEEGITGEYCYKASHSLYSPCCETGETCPVSVTLKTGEPQTAAHTHYDEAGQPVFVEIKSFPVKDDSGKVVAAIEVINNVTERKKLEDQLRHAQKMEAVGTLAGGVAHDFNNVLNVIIGYGTMLMDRLGDDSLSREQLHEVLAAADRAANLTKRLLAFSRKQVVEVKPVNVNEIIAGIERMLCRIISEDIVFTLELTSGKMIVMADAGQIEQVLMNLVSNARYAMLKGGKLTISTGIKEMDDAYITAYGYGKTGTYALISVTDTGSGMDAETQKKIFEPFFTTKGVGEGTGLGLSIVYGIIKQHDGYINVYSEPGKGTEFKIYLPLIEEETANGKEVEAVTTLKGGTETILLAEDDASLRKLSRTVLESFGYTVITAEDGEEAITKYMENRDKIRLVVLDMIMPKKNGKEAYEEIRRISPDVKTLFVSGHTMDVITNKELIDAGIDYVLKPVSPRDLLKKVREVLNREPEKGAKP